MPSTCSVTWLWVILPAGARARSRMSCSLSVAVGTAEHRNCHRRVANSRSLQAQVVEGPDHCRKSTPAGSRRRRKVSGTGVKRIAREHKHARIDTNALRESGGGARSAQESGGERPRSSRHVFGASAGALLERSFSERRERIPPCRRPFADGISQLIG